MKKFTKMIYALAALPFVFTSCVEEVLREPGAPDLENCQGIYFKELTKAQKNVELDPTEATELSFTVLRPNSEDVADLPAITVPVTLQSPKLENGEDVFSLSEIKFEEGQTETTVTATFPNAELGVPYTCNVLLEDPEFASVYTKKPLALSFTITRVKWVPVKGTAGEEKLLYRDDFVSGLFGLEPTEREVLVEQRDDKKGYFRIKNLYTTEWVYDIFVDGEIFKVTPPFELFESWGIVSDATVYIDATNPKKVIWEHGPLGLDLSPLELGIFESPVYAGSFCVENDKEQLGKKPITPDISLYGLMKDGVLKFPEESIYFKTVDGLYPIFGATTRFIFPGAKDVDYSLKIETGLSEEGVLPVSVVKGLNIDAAKYAVLEGVLPAKEVNAKAAEIAAGKLEAKAIEFDKDGIAEFGVTLDKTGVYTIVIAAFENNKPVAAKGVDFGYVAKDDEKPVMITAGAIVSDKYRPEGATVENSVEVYFYGKDLKNVRYGLYPLNLCTGRPADVMADLLESDPLAGEDLELVNGKGISEVIGKLKPGTQYVLYVLADNGFEEKLLKVEVATEGKYDPLKDTYYANNLNPISNLDKISERKLGVLSGKVSARKYTSDISISEIFADPESGMVFYGISGLWSPLVDKAYKMKEDVDVYVDMGLGVLLNYPELSMTEVTHEDKTYYGSPSVDYSVISMPMPMAYFIGETDEGNLALVDSEQYVELAGYSTGLSYHLYSEAVGDPNFQVTEKPLATHRNVLFVESDKIPEAYKPEEKPAPAPAPAFAKPEQFEVADSYNVFGHQITLAYLRQKCEKLAASLRLSKGTRLDIESEPSTPSVNAQTVALDGQYEFKKVLPLDIDLSRLHLN